jgi:tRNA U34 5-carboxymethylaminomethyl modifying enzyme MnmG/GidA
MAVGLDIGPNEELRGVTTYFGITFRCRAAVLTTGTFMNGLIWVGRQSMPAGRCVACVFLCMCVVCICVCVCAFVCIAHV